MLRKYRCHKVVQAAEIKALEEMPNTVQPGGPNQLRHAILEDGSRYGGDIFAREKKPVVGDFIVIYDDGHISWSPRKAFLDGYSPIDETGADYQPEQVHP